MSREAFADAFESMYATLEKRRRYNVFLFYFYLFLAVLTVISIVFFPRWSLLKIAMVLHHTASVSGLEIASFIFFGSCCAIALIVGPLLRYRGGLTENHSLQRVLLLALSQWLGECSLASPATSFAHLARASGMFPEYAGISEQVGIKGTRNGCRYTLQEMAVSIIAENGTDNCIFHGLVVVCNPLKRSVLIHGERQKKALLYKTKHFKSDDLTAVNWDSSALEKVESPDVERLSTVSTPAFDTLNTLDPWFETFQSTANMCAALQRPREEWDTKLLSALEKLHDYVRLKLASRSGKRPLAAELAYDSQFCKSPDIRNAIQSESSPFAGAFAVAWLEDSCIVALPCPAPVFLTGSLFNPSWSSEYAMMLYDIIACIDNRIFDLPMPDCGGQ